MNYQCKLEGCSLDPCVCLFLCMCRSRAPLSVKHAEERTEKITLTCSQVPKLCTDWFNVNVIRSVPACELWSNCETRQCWSNMTQYYVTVLPCSVLRNIFNFMSSCTIRKLEICGVTQIIRQTSNGLLHGDLCHGGNQTSFIWTWYRAGLK